MLESSTIWLKFSVYSLLTAISFMVIFTWYMMRNNNYWKNRGVPYVKPIPILGNVYEVIFGKIHLGQLLRKIYEKHPNPFVGIFCCDEPSLVINDIELMKAVLVKDFEHFSERSVIANNKSDTISPKMLFFAKAALWKKERKKVSPLLSPAKLKNQLAAAHICMRQMINHLKIKISEGENIFLAKDIGDIHAIGSFSRVFYGLENDCFKNENSPLMEVFGKIMNFTKLWHGFQTVCMFVAPTFFKIFRMEFIDSYCTESFRAINWELIKKREESGTKYNDLVDFLVERKCMDNICDPKSREADILIGHSVQLFLAGFETTGTAICLALFELAKYPECQKLAREEVLAAKDKYGELSFECLESMTYLKNCLKEVLRLHPPLPFLDRKCVKEYKLPGTDLVIEKGQSVLIPVMGIHNDSRYYPNPSSFDPERFSHGNIPDIAYLSFGGGPRYCPGKRYGFLNSVMAVAGILSNFYVELPDSIRYNMEPCIAFLWQPKNKIPLKFVEIH